MLLHTSALFIVTTFLISAGAQTPPPATEPPAPPPAPVAPAKPAFPGKPIFAQTPKAAGPSKPIAPSKPAGPPKPVAKDAPPAEQAKFVGTWELITMDALTDGQWNPQGGFPKPHGRLIYDSTGRMTLLITDSSRLKFPAADPEKPDLLEVQPESIRGSFGRMVSFSGFYKALEGKTVRHKIDIAFIPNWEGTSQERDYEFKKNTLILKNESTPEPGKTVVKRMIWKRIK